MNRHKTTFFFLTPLLYSIDGDPYRAYEVLLTATVVLILFFRPRIVRINMTDVLLATAYSLFLVVQQLFIPRGSVPFGINFMIVTLAAYFPFWVLRSTHWYMNGISSGLRNGIHVLFWVAFLSISTSFFFGVGERIVSSGLLGARAFGYLGDSFSPVVAFLLLYFLFERKPVYVAMLLAVMGMTGGKAAILLVMLALSIFVLFVVRSVLKRVIAFVLVLILTVFSIAVRDLAGEFSDLTEFSLNNRLFSFAVGLKYFYEDPIFGIGINGALSRIHFDVDLYARNLGENNYFPVYNIHNAYIRALAETGVVGFSILLMLALFWIITSIKAIRIARLLPSGSERSTIIAAALWVIAFVLSYQSTGWFLGGHPQFAWLLMFSTLAIILSQRAKKVSKHSQTKLASNADRTILPHDTAKT